MAVTAPLDEASARYVLTALGPAPLPERERLRRRVEALETRLRVIADTVATLPAGTAPADISKLIRQLAGI